MRDGMFFLEGWLGPAKPERRRQVPSESTNLSVQTTPTGKQVCPCCPNRVVFRGIFVGMRGSL